MYKIYEENYNNLDKQSQTKKKKKKKDIRHSRTVILNTVKISVPPCGSTNLIDSKSKS